MSRLVLSCCSTVLQQQEQQQGQQQQQQEEHYLVNQTPYPLMSWLRLQFKRMQKKGAP